MRQLKAISIGLLCIALCLCVVAGAVVREAWTSLVYGTEHERGGGIGRPEDYA